MTVCLLTGNHLRSPLIRKTCKWDQIARSLLMSKICLCKGDQRARSLLMRKVVRCQRYQCTRRRTITPPRIFPQWTANLPSPPSVSDSLLPLCYVPPQIHPTTVRVGIHRHRFQGTWVVGIKLPVVTAQQQALPTVSARGLLQGWSWWKSGWIVWVLWWQHSEAHPTGCPCHQLQLKKGNT